MRRPISSHTLGRYHRRAAPNRPDGRDHFSRLNPASRPLSKPGGELSWCPGCTQLCDDTIRRVGAIYALRTADLDDFVQDAWLTVLNAVAAGRFNPNRGRLIDWLFILARNRVTTFFRQRARHRGVKTQLDGLPGHTFEDPAAMVQRASDVKRVRRALITLKQRVSPLCYSTFYLRQMQQWSVNEIATQLQLSREQVRAYDFRARRKLAVILTYHEVT